MPDAHAGRRRDSVGDGRQGRCDAGFAYTAHAMPEAIEGFKAAGFDDVLIKPITREKLMRALGLE